MSQECNAKAPGRRVIAAETFEETAATLGRDAEVGRLVRELARRATEFPEQGQSFPGRLVRVMQSRSYGRYPALRLYYTYDAEKVLLLVVERYDELEA